MNSIAKGAVGATGETSSTPLINLSWWSLPVYGIALLLPFNVIGGSWGGAPEVLAGKVLLNVLFAAALGAAAIRVGRSRWNWARSDSIILAAIVFAICVVLSGLVGFIHVLAAAEPAQDWLRETNWLSFFAFTPAVAALVRTRKEIAIILALLTFSALLSEVASLHFFLTAPRYSRFDWAGGESFQRAPFSEANLFVLYAAFATLILFRPMKPATKVQLAGLIGVVLVLGLGLLANVGRGLWISSAVGFGVILILAAWNRRTLYLIGIVIVSAAVGLAAIQLVYSFTSPSVNWAANVWNFVTALTNGRETSIVGRLTETANGLAVWRRNPIFGAGLGAPFPHTSYDPPTLARFYIHNSYINVLAKMGLIGFLSFLGLIAATSRRAISGLRNTALGAAGRTLMVALIATFTQVLLLSFAAPVVTTTDSVLFFALLVGLVAVLANAFAAASQTESTFP